MPRCNLTLRQKLQIIELSSKLSSEQIAKKYHVHQTTITRTVKKKKKILDHATRVNVNFKTIQTNQLGEEHDRSVLEYIRTKQNANEPVSIKEICDRAAELAKDVGKCIKSKRGWWRRFKVRCNIIRSKVQKSKISNPPAIQAESPVTKQDEKTSGKQKTKKTKHKVAKGTKRKDYTFKIKEPTATIPTGGTEICKGFDAAHTSSMNEQTNTHAD